MSNFRPKMKLSAGENSPAVSTLSATLISFEEIRKVLARKTGKNPCDNTVRKFLRNMGMSPVVEGVFRVSDALPGAGASGAPFAAATSKRNAGNQPSTKTNK